MHYNFLITLTWYCYDVIIITYEGSNSTVPLMVKVLNPNAQMVSGNFEQYSLLHKYVDLVVADSAAPPWRTMSKLFEAIVTDPPYGIREPTEKIGTSRKNPEIPKEFLEVHFPQKVIILQQIFLYVDWGM